MPDTTKDKELPKIDTSNIEEEDDSKDSEDFKWSICCKNVKIACKSRA